MHRVNFLDVTFDLRNGKYWPYRKPNDQPLYINKESNHPPNIIEQLPIMIEKRISDISCDEQEFDKVKDEYNKALENSGYTHKLKYIKTAPKARSRTRKVIWFNPPYNAQVETDVGRVFLNLVKKHFPRHHKYSKIFNKNTIKISYSCMPNMKSIISKHNRKVLNTRPVPMNTKTCNCINRATCPLDGQCLSTAIVYKADITSGETSKQYLGSTEPVFKRRLATHKHSFINRTREADTCLSKHVWEAKDRQANYDIKWTIHRQAFPYQCGSRKCDLCLTEKLSILNSDPACTLNKRSEIMNKCRHRSKYKLNKVK